MQIQCLQSNKYLANTYVIKNNNKCFIIDCGVSVQSIKNAVGDCQVEGVLLTHGHFDHIYYVKDYLNTFNCPLYCSSLCFDKLNNPQKNLSNMLVNNQVVISINKYNCLDNIKELNLADINIMIMTLPGHSECSLGYVVNNNIFCGDVLFKNAVGRTDFYDGNAQKLEQSLNIIFSLAPVNVFCGHGENFAITGVDN